MSFPVLPNNGRTLHMETFEDRMFETNIAAPIEDLIQVARWGTYGKGGKEPLKWVKLIDCETEHLEAILRTQPQIGRGYRRMIQTILHQRKTQTKEPNTAMSTQQSALAEQPTLTRPIKNGEILRLGTKVQDKVTKIVGWAYYRILHLQGCDHIALAQPGATDEGKMKDLYSTDVLNLEIMLDQSDCLPYPAPANPLLWVGDKVRCPLTFREGTITGYHIGLFDGRHVSVQPEGTDVKTGKVKSSFHMEEGRAILLEKGPNHGQPIVYSEQTVEKPRGSSNVQLRQPD